MGGEHESIEAVQLSTQELTLTSTGPVPNLVPEARILDIPFLLHDKAHARNVPDGQIGQDMLVKFDQMQKHTSLTGHVYSPGIFFIYY